MAPNNVLDLPAAVHVSMRHRVLATLTTWPFVLNVVILLLNDFWMKQVFPGILSGKLSDFAGIAIVTLLLLAFTRRRRYLVFAGIAAGFAYWKSPLSEPLIESTNSWLPWSIGRVIDYTDLLALIVIPGCARVAANTSRFQVPGRSLRRLLFPPVVVLTSFALIATPATLIHREYTLQPMASDTLDPGLIAEIIWQAVTRHDLHCEECTHPQERATFSNPYLRLTYELGAERRGTIRILQGQGGLPIGSRKGVEKADALYLELCQSLKGSQVDLEFNPPYAPRVN
jgi:hypothetical protein